MVVRLGREAAQVASAGLLPASIVAQLVAGHNQEQMQQLLRLAQGEHANANANEKVAHHRLTDIDRVHAPPQPGITEKDAHDPAQLRLKLTHQVRSGGLVAVADALEQTKKRV